MHSSSLRENECYYKIENYAMKCRLYPNKEVAQKIDAAIYGIQSFYNCTLYEMFSNHNLLTERRKKIKNGNEENGVVHFPDYKAIGSVEWKHKVISEHPVIDNAPSSAITCKSGVISDMKRSLGKNPIEYQKPMFYNKAKPRRSYSYQETYRKITFSSNENVIYVNLAKIGTCKIRGWNKNIRFDKDGAINFADFCKEQALLGKSITLTISKDNCCDYWIVFKLPYVFKPMANKTENAIGIDVGIKDLAILSDGTKYENKKLKAKQKGLERKLSRQLCRRQGYRNEEFRAKIKKGEQIDVSKRYQETQLRLSKLHRDIARKRNNYNNCVTTDIIAKNGFIGVESLNVKGMYKNRNMAKYLADAAMGDILQKLKYKADWYDRTVQPIDRWDPSSQKCSCCGYIQSTLTLENREWDCPKCGTHHDRDINAALNIKKSALEIYNNNCNI